jgi:hypothetical protein
MRTAVWGEADDRVTDHHYVTAGSGGSVGVKTAITGRTDGECDDLAAINANWRRIVNVQHNLDGMASTANTLYKQCASKKSRILCHYPTVGKFWKCGKSMWGNAGNLRGLWEIIHISHIPRA